MRKRFKTGNPPNEAKAIAERAEYGRAGSRPRWSLLLRAFKHRNYRLFFGGQLISLIGTWMQSMAQLWLVYKLTGSAVSLGLVGFSGQIPVFLFSSIGGAVADRTNRHRILVATQTASMLLAFVLAALTLTHQVQVGHIYLLAALLGVVNAFDVPARQAFVVEMVGKEDLVNAIALNSSVFNSARIIGPAIGGVLVAAIGEGWCFLANALSYLAVILGLLLMKMEPGKRFFGPDRPYPVSSRDSAMSGKPGRFAPCWFCWDWSAYWVCPIWCSCRFLRPRSSMAGRKDWEP